MGWPAWSLRRRVLVLLAVLITAGLGLADLVTYRSLHSSLLEREDAQLDTLARGAARELVTGSGFPLQFRVRAGAGAIQPFVEAQAADGSASATIPASEGGQVLAPPSLPRHLAVPTLVEGEDLTDQARYLTVPSTRAGQAPYRVRVGPLLDGPLLVPGETLVVAAPLADVEATMHSLFWTEFAVSSAVLLLALLAGAWLVRLGLRPLEEMADTAGQIAAGRLDRRVAATGSDQTEVGRLGLSLNRMLDRIEGAFAEKEASEARLRRFVADASHELRTPLTSIRGYAELFRRGADRRPEDLAKAMRRIEEEAGRMGVLVDDLLLLARLDQGRPLDLAPVELSAVVTEAVEAARVVEPDRPYRLDAHPALTVSGDRHRLRQVIDNLLVNVRVHTPPCAPASIRLHAAGPEVVLEVEDSGSGVAADLRPRVFERFYRADASRAAASGGAGLGLSIVESIVAAHGGRAEVGDGEVGALFRIRLPLLGPAAVGPAGYSVVSSPERPELSEPPESSPSWAPPWGRGSSG